MNEWRLHYSTEADIFYIMLMFILQKWIVKIRLSVTQHSRLHLNHCRCSRCLPCSATKFSLCATWKINFHCAPPGKSIFIVCHLENQFSLCATWKINFHCAPPGKSIFIVRHLKNQFSLCATWKINFHCAPPGKSIFIVRHLENQFSLCATWKINFHFVPPGKSIFIVCHLENQFSLCVTWKISDFLFINFSKGQAGRQA